MTKKNAARAEAVKVETEGRADHAKVTLANGYVVMVPKNHPLAQVGAVVENKS